MGSMTEFLTDVSGILLYPQTTIHKIEARDIGLEVPELAKRTDEVMGVYIHFTAPFKSDFKADVFDDKPNSTLTPRDLRLIGAVANTRAFMVKYEIRSRMDTEVEIEAVFCAPRNPDWGFNNN